MNRELLKHVWPALSFFLPLLLFFCPWDWLTYPFFGVSKRGFSQRWGLLCELGAVLIAPFSKGSFQRCFIADVLCSMPKVFTDIQYTLCIYITGTFLDTSKDEWETSKVLHGYGTCGDGNRYYLVLSVFMSLFPFYIRFCQCVRAYILEGRESRQIFNSFKYALSLTVSILSSAIHYSAVNKNHVLVTVWVAFSIVTTAYSFYWDVVVDWY